MALLPVSDDSDEDFRSLSSHEPDEDCIEEEDDGLEAPPTHPLPSMQNAFEESIQESTEEEDSNKSPVTADPQGHRHKLLNTPLYDDSWTTWWKQKSSARYHPLLKLMAQIVFGMHLLQQQQAKSDEQVVKILQTHVDEVDNFLEKTTKDFDLALRDIEERIQFLKLPMKHMEVFEIMLDDKKFRLGLIDGNVKIEDIIERTAKAMHAALLDVIKGIHATEELKGYLDNIKSDWPTETVDLRAIYNAMRGNEEGWMRCLRDLQEKGNKLNVALVQLGTIIGKISKLAAAASRQSVRTFAGSNGSSPGSSRSGPSSPAPQSKFNAGNRSSSSRNSQSPAINKPLPKDPDTAGTALGATIPKIHTIPFEQRFEKPRQGPPIPQSITDSERLRQQPASSTTPRLNISGTMKARDPRIRTTSDSTELAESPQAGNPLSMNPPSRPTSRSSSSGPERAQNKHPGSSGAETTLSRNGSIGANKALNHQPASSSALKVFNRRGSSRANSLLNGTSLATVGAEHAPSDSTKVNNGRQATVSSHATGFSRRLSKRPKHLPPSEAARKSTCNAAAIAENPLEKNVPPPSDSAYNSGTDTEPSATAYDETNEQQQQQQIPPQSASDKTHSRSPARSRLGLLPKTEPLTPSAVLTHSSRRRSPAASPAVLTAPNPNSTAIASRSLSIRNIFRRKSKSRAALL